MTDPIAADRPVLGAYATDDAVYYLFLAPAGVRAVRRERSARPLPALAAERPAFAWDEREMADERGVRFAGAVDARPFRAHGGVMPDAVVAGGPGLVRIVVGPVHAGIIEPGRFTFSSGGETVVHLDAQLGYAHRGVERALEGADPIAAAVRVARICGSCSAARAHAYALALEGPAGAEAAPAAALARLVVCELERIWNHVGDLAMCASAAGWMPGFTRGLTLKERLLRCNERAAGHRLLFDAIVPGGVAEGVLADRAGLRAELRALADETAAYAEGVFANRSVRSRWHRTGTLDGPSARALGVTGPPARAAGIGIDVRAVAPYGAYRGAAFAPALAAGGDVFARCSVKRAELGSAFELIAAALTELGSAALPPPAAPAAEEGCGFAVVEGPRGAETVAVHVAAGRIARFHLASASYRNWPAVARAMEANIVPDFPLVNKSFNLCYACADR